MATFAKIKCFVSSFLLFYVIYLWTYRCGQLDNLYSPLNAIKSKIAGDHPESVELIKDIPVVFKNEVDSFEFAACGKLNQFELWVKPYTASGFAWLDAHVYSHPTFKKYAMADKLTFAKTKYYQFVHPLVLEVFQYIEMLQYKVAELTSPLIAKVKKSVN
ncbi:uncharacterized protein KQ657_003151 [Scheffersomyces spartinae]|uniref:Uncharacterized protein n=1 Tax=Scheffersomyces spartinae TaxID=45513 RepID=A0A9P8AK20_9ASCO|nr:uncharacterized protein KQ657_003151 [Scheffersomyces spartinae]KAG7195393.1 hypothetical protein KQ657_003151 [Scheffersomyces spartinae]